MSLVTRRGIADVEDAIAELAPEARAAAERIFAISTTTGRLDPPPEMHDWIRRLFGSVDAVREQRIIRITNLVTLEGALFNELRARRPMDSKGGDDAGAAIAESVGDPFCEPLTRTPPDSFGRVTGRFGVSASNIAKYDGHHGVLVFNEHDPLAPKSADEIRDHLMTARRWAEAALEDDPAARYYLLLWNCLWRAGASIVHGHMQMVSTRGLHYPTVERLRRQALAYDERHRRDYFDDLWLVHAALGLGVEVDGARLFASLVPVKEREVVIVGRPGVEESSLASAIAKVVAAYRAEGVVSYNLALYLPPLSPEGTDWRRFPPVARIVDRGDVANRTSDIGAMELYAASVIATDPFQLARTLVA